MLKRKIDYEDFNGDKCSEEFYFNLSKPELIEMEVEYKEGFGEVLKKIVAEKDNKELIKKFKEIVLAAYGVRSEDGKRFIKNDKLREEFSQTAAYQHLFMELATNSNVAEIFIKGILPKDVVMEVDQDKPKGPPPVPTPPTS